MRARARGRAAACMLHAEALITRKAVVSNGPPRCLRACAHADFAKFVRKVFAHPKIASAIAQWVLHSNRHLRKSDCPLTQEFNEYLKQAVTAEPQEQEARLVGWQQAPHARFAHPREEHLLPLHVVAGAADCRPASVIFDNTLWGAPLSSYQYV